MLKTYQIDLIKGVVICIWHKIIYFDCIRVILLDKQKTTEAHEYA